MNYQERHILNTLSTKMKKLSLAIDSPVESNHRGSTGRDNIPAQQRPKDLYDINDDDIGDDDDSALIDQANF